jgi:hypothetical protein
VPSIHDGTNIHRKGINYDTGIAPLGDRLSRRDFDPEQVRREIAIITPRSAW